MQTQTRAEVLTQKGAEVQTQTSAEVLTQKVAEVQNSDEGRDAKLRRVAEVQNSDESRGAKLRRVAEVKTPKMVAWKESSVVEKGSDAVCDVARQDNISTADKG